MNRLTKNISLVLISSSLALYGCQPPASKPLDKSTNDDQPGSPSTTSNGSRSQPSSPHHGSHVVPHVWGPSQASGLHSRPSSSGPSSAGHSSSVSSARGGFGSSAHGVAS